MAEQILFWTQVSAIGQVAGALATATAVIVSLWVVLSDRTPRIKATAGIRLVVGGGVPAIDVMTFTLTNIGTRTAVIGGIGWRMGWFPVGPKWLKHSYAVQTLGPPVTMPGSSVPPFELAPGERKSITILLDRYEAHKRNDRVFTRKIPFVKAPVPGNIHLLVEIVAARTTLVNAPNFWPPEKLKRERCTSTLLHPNRTSRVHRTYCCPSSHHAPPLQTPSLPSFGSAHSTSS